MQKPTEIKKTIYVKKKEKTQGVMGVAKKIKNKHREKSKGNKGKSRK